MKDKCTKASALSARARVAKTQASARHLLYSLKTFLCAPLAAIGIDFQLRLNRSPRKLLRPGLTRKGGKNRGKNPSAGGTGWAPFDLSKSRESDATPPRRKMQPSQSHVQLACSSAPPQPRCTTDAIFDQKFAPVVPPPVFVEISDGKNRGPLNL